MRIRLAPLVANILDNPSKIAVVVLAAGVCYAGIEFLVHDAVVSVGGSEFLHIGVDAGLEALLTLIILLGARHHRQMMLQEMRQIAELNHNVRNALQVVVHSQYVPDTSKQREAVLESMDRIDGTLRKLFPSIADWESVEPEPKRPARSEKPDRARKWRILRR